MKQPVEIPDIHAAFDLAQEFADLDKSGWLVVTRDRLTLTGWQRLGYVIMPRGRWETERHKYEYSYTYDVSPSYAAYTSE